MKLKRKILKSKNRCCGGNRGLTSCNSRHFAIPRLRELHKLASNTSKVSHDVILDCSHRKQHKFINLIKGKTGSTAQLRLWLDEMEIFN